VTKGLSFIVRLPSRFIVGLKVKDMDFDRFFISVFGIINPRAGNDHLFMIKEAKNIEKKLLQFSTVFFSIVIITIANKTPLFGIWSNVYAPKNPFHCRMSCHMPHICKNHHQKPFRKIISKVLFNG
jgi:hypothetical protein